jgi:hypothetical protein
VDAADAASDRDFRRGRHAPRKLRAQRTIIRARIPEIDQFRGAAQGDYEQGVFFATTNFSAGAILNVCKAPRRGLIMHIETELDPIHGERLRILQRKLNKPLDEVLGVAIDAALQRFDGGTDESEPSPLYAALDAIGYVGCIDGEEDLSREYKSRLDFSGKAGPRG